MKGKKYLYTIRGTIETNIALDKWTNKFVEWVESRDEYFGGGVSASKPCPDCGESLVSEKGKLVCLNDACPLIEIVWKKGKKHVKRESTTK